MPARRALPAFVFGLLVAALGCCFLMEPLLGDDVTYWSFALALHERGLSAWGAETFYTLRWPVWGLCWLLQLLGPGDLFSFWGGPVLYLTAGALLTFHLGRRLTNNFIFVAGAGIAFVFHPFLDAIVGVPMPDLPEAVWGAATMLAWWQTMHADSARRAWLGASATGFFIVVLEADRVTGVLIVPVLVLCTATFFRTRFRWLLAAGLVALLLYAGECFFYHWLLGDWRHDLTANALNRGAQGTELENPWQLPFRFFGCFVHGPLMRIYSLFTLAGIWLAWRRGRVFGRVLVLWVVLLFLEYSCATQGLRPIRPLVRDAPRFLAGLATPMSLLAVFALRELLRLEFTRTAFARFGSHRMARPILGAGVLLFLLLTTQRSLWHWGFIPEMRRYLQAVPDNADIFTHASMRELVRLVAPRDAARFRWTAPSEILESDAALEAAAARADEFWYIRKLSWGRTRQRLYRGKDTSPPRLAAYFSKPEPTWRLAQVLLKDDAPDLVFYRKRRSAEGPPRILESDAPEWNGLVPALPLVWEKGGRAGWENSWQIPESCRGRLVRLEVRAAADQVEACWLRLRFGAGRRHPKKFQILQPYLTQQGGLDFFALAIPAGSTSCEIQLRFAEKTERMELTDFRAILEPPASP